MSKKSTRIKQPEHERTLVNMGREQHDAAQTIKSAVDTREARMAEFDASKVLRRGASADHAKGMREILGSVSGQENHAAVIGGMSGARSMAMGNADKTAMGGKLQNMTASIQNRLGATSVATSSLSGLNNMQSQLNTQKMKNRMQQEMDIISFGGKVASGYTQGVESKKLNSAAEARNKSLEDLLKGVVSNSGGGA